MLSNFQQSRAVVAQAVFALDTFLCVGEDAFLLIRQPNRDLSAPALCQLTLCDARCYLSNLHAMWPQRAAANRCLRFNVSTSCGMRAAGVVLHAAERLVRHPDCW